MKRYYISKERMKWSEASDLCTKYGLKFASLNNVGEARLVFQLLNDLWESRFKSSLAGWIIHVNGATKVSKSKKDFHWTETPEINLENEDWVDGEPNNAHNNEFCLSILTYRKDNKVMHGFNDVSCDEEWHRTLCEKSLKF
jgi:hypothetical protein